MQDTLRSTERGYATRPNSRASHRSVSPYPLSYVPESPFLPDSGPGLKQYRQDEARRTRQRSAIPLIKTGSAPESSQGHNSHISTERPRGSFESFYTHGEHREFPIERPVEFTDSPSSGMLSPYHISTPSALPSGTIIRQDADYGPRTNDPARDNGGFYRPRVPEQRSRSESDNWRYANSIQQVYSSPPRLTPMRRGFSDSPISGTSTPNGYPPTRSSRLASVPDLRQVQWGGENVAQFERPQRLPALLRSLPEDESPPRRTIDQDEPLREREHRARPRTVQPQQSQEQLTPLRRTFAEPPASAPVAASRISPMGSVFPRLSSILGRHSRFLIRDMPEDMSEGGGSPDSEVPPAYESLTPRRGPSQASQQNRDSVRPLPLPITPSPASS